MPLPMIHEIAGKEHALFAFDARLGNEIKLD
jgi:hypothetical protein